MEKSMQVINDKLPSKQVLGNYVHDAAELEFELYTLQKSREELKGRIEKERKRDVTVEVKKPKYEKNLTFPSEPQNEETDDGRFCAIEKYRKVHRSKYFKNGLYFFLVISLHWLAVCLYLYWDTVNDVNTDTDTLGGALVMCLGIFIIYILPIILFIVLAEIKTKYNRKLDNQAVEEYRSEINKQHAKAVKYWEKECAEVSAKNKVTAAKNEVERIEYGARCQKRKQEHERYLAALKVQLDDLDTQIAKANAQRQSFYAVGIVPVDYRTLDCAFVLDQIFRNDLADTMREGIKLYEERVYRGEVIKGIASIVSHLDNLTGLMGDLGQRLNRINTEVSMMSNDLFQMADRQSRMQEEMNDSNRRVLEESRLHRYATEALNRNAEKIIQYCETSSSD